MSAVAFTAAFNQVANELRLPAKGRDALCAELWRTVDNPREGARAVERWLADKAFSWPDGERFLLEWQNRRPTFKALAALLAHYVVGKWNVMGEWERHSRARATHSFVKLSRGPLIKPCPLHADREGAVFSVDDPYLADTPLRATVFCRCHIRGVSREEAARLGVL
jgi:hypothetical protein